ncbi:Receptor-type tyrosine-protein like [Quillaja saponaria]|uniref:Receptor-type tyrosine-protein like n=1 Tax=Quillaja saponaria TaxID=32244 RepID=A0AAD7L4L5_QUISA|nr:Receptor-type tyrosine-protein like [Quillaja saponaria]
MAEDQEELLHPTSTQTHTTPFSRCPTRRRILLRRRKLPIFCLGGNRPRRVLVLVKMWRRMRLRWFKLQYLCMLKKVKKYYKSLIKDMVETGASFETFQQRVLVDPSFAVPIGLSFSTYPYLP